MPTYVYACQVCRQVIERRQRFQDDPLTVCEQCGGGLRKVMQPVGIISRGSGSYPTDDQAGKASAIPENGGGESTPSESSPAGESSSGSDGSAPAPAEGASAKDASGPTKEAAVPAAAGSTSGDRDAGHRPAQRGSSWTTYIR